MYYRTVILSLSSLRISSPSSLTLLLPSLWPLVCYVDFPSYSHDLLFAGQRYDVVFTANQAVGNYWLRVTIDTACSRNAIIASGKVIGSIVSYVGADNSLPTSTASTIRTGCYDETVTPYVSNTVPSSNFADALKKFQVDLRLGTSANGPIVQWLINGTDIDVDWSRPTLSYVQDGDTNYTPKMNLFELNEANQWFYWIIQTGLNQPINLPHPIHLHGHDFYVLGAGAGQWNGDLSGLKFVNPIRRDTATLPAGGWLVVAFPSDNPGAWLMHCHIVSNLLA